MQNTIDTYDRSYKKIQDIAGGVDGIIEILMLIAKFINQIFIHDFKLLNDFNYEYDKIFNHKNKGFYIGNKKKKYNILFLIMLFLILMIMIFLIIVKV